MNKYCWKFFFLCHSDLFSSSLYCSICFLYVIKFRVLKISITLSLENRPKPTETDIHWNRWFSNHFDRFRLRISQTEIFGFGWPYLYKPTETEPSTPLSPTLSNYVTITTPSYYFYSMKDFTRTYFSNNMPFKIIMRYYFQSHKRPRRN